MKRTLCTLLILSLLLSMSVPALATEGEESTPTTHTASTLDELKTALTYAVDNDTIVISNGITIADEIISTDKAVTLTRADGYAGDLLILGSNGGLSGFTIYDDAAFSSTVLVAVDAENVTIEDCAFSGDGETFTYFVSAYSGVTITDSTFCDNGGVALAIPNSAATVTVSNCTFADNIPPTGESAITNSGTLLLENTEIYRNTGGIFNSGTLTVSSSEIYSNTEADLYNRGTLNIAESAEGSGYYKADTGEKLTLPLSDYSDTVNLLYLTDEAAAERFAPPEEDTSPETPPIEETPPVVTPPEDEPEPTPEPDNDDDYTPPVYRPSRPVVTTTPDPDPEPDPEPTPALICGDAVIDLSRSVVLHGYGDGQLHLEDSLTRAQMATIIYRLLDEDTLAKYSTTRSTFEDVPADMWCCSYVSAIANAGIVNGVGNDRFNPNGKLTWAHIITVMTRFVEPQTCQLQNIQYDGWAAGAVQTAFALGWIEDGADFDPNAFITRGEFMEFVNNILALYQTI